MTLRGGPGDDEIHRVRNPPGPPPGPKGFALSRQRLHRRDDRGGATIGEAWRSAGHDVTHASRSSQPLGTIGIADAIALADLVLLAMPSAAVPALVAAHRDALNGRLVVNATSDVGAERLHRAERLRPVRPRAPGSPPGARDSHARSTRSASRCSRTQRWGEAAQRWGEAAGPLLVRAQGRRRRAADRRRRLATGARRRHRRDRRRRRRPALTDTRDPRGLAAVRPAPFSARSRCVAREPVTVTRFCGQTADDLPNACRRDAISRPGPAGRARRTRR